MRPSRTLNWPTVDKTMVINIIRKTTADNAGGNGDDGCGGDSNDVGVIRGGDNIGVDLSADDAGAARFDDSGCWVIASVFYT